MGKSGLLGGTGSPSLTSLSRGRSPVASKPLRGSLKDVSGYTVSSQANQPAGVEWGVHPPPPPSGVHQRGHPEFPACLPGADTPPSVTSAPAAAPALPKTPAGRTCADLLTQRHDPRGTLAGGAHRLAVSDPHCRAGPPQNHHPEGQCVGDRLL